MKKYLILITATLLITSMTPALGQTLSSDWCAQCQVTASGGCDASQMGFKGHNSCICVNEELIKCKCTGLCGGASDPVEASNFQEVIDEYSSGASQYITLTEKYDYVNEGGFEKALIEDELQQNIFFYRNRFYYWISDQMLISLASENGEAIIEGCNELERIIINKI